MYQIEGHSKQVILMCNGELKRVWDQGQLWNENMCQNNKLGTDKENI